MGRHYQPRADTVELFLRSGDPVWLVTVDPDYNPESVSLALQKAIRSRPFFKNRCEAFLKNGRVFLVRKEHEP